MLISCTCWIEVFHYLIDIVSGVASSRFVVMKNLLFNKREASKAVYNNWWFHCYNKDPRTSGYKTAAILQAEIQ